MGVHVVDQPIDWHPGTLPSALALVLVHASQFRLDGIEVLLRARSDKQLVRFAFDNDTRRPL